jgi:hypothetical protein
MVSVGVIAADGTKLHVNASRDANLHYEQVAGKVLAEAAEVGEQEDERYGENRGDELALTLARREGRRAWLREARQGTHDLGAGEELATFGAHAATRAVVRSAAYLGVSLRLGPS